MTSFGFALLSGPTPGPAVLSGDRVRPLADLWPGGPRTVGELLADWDHALDHVAAAIAGGTEDWTPADDATYRAPADDRATLYSCGANYYDHIEEMGGTAPDKATARPFHFLVPRAALCGHGAEVVRPPGVTRLDWEVELAAVIGRTADRVTADRALEHVAAYTIANDVSCRDPERARNPTFGMNWLWSKGQATLQPLGPALVPTRFVPDPSALRLRLTVDDTIRQDSSTAKMIFTLPEQIEALSHNAPLHPGDIILTGTPAGTAAAYDAYLDDGATMIAEIEGVGTLRNRVAATP